MKFRVSQNATEATLANGQPLVRGEEITLTPELRDDPFNARLIVEGQLLPINERTQNKALEEAQAAVDRPNPPDPPPAHYDTPNTEGGAS